MAPSNNSKRPSFFWQGLMIILPVLVLAVVGLFSLRQDEQAAEQAARKKAADNAVSLARAISATADEQLAEYQRLQLDWGSGLFEAALSSSTKGNQSHTVTNFPDLDLKAKIIRWEKAYPGIHFDAFVSLPGVLADPTIPSRVPYLAPVPVPPKWFLELSPVQREAWQALRQSQSADLAPAAIASAWKAFLGTNPSAGSQLAASNYARLRSDQSDQDDYLGFTESGLPFANIACMQALDRTAITPWSTRLLDQLGMQVLYNPSFLTPALLEKANEHPPSDAVMQARLRLIKKAWEMQSISRQRTQTLRRQPELLSTNLWSQSIWIHAPAVEALAGPMGSIATNHGATSYVYDIYFIPLPVVEAIFAKSLTENQFLVPDYATPGISVEGERLLTSGSKLAPDEKSWLAGATQKWGNPFLQNVTFNVAFYLTSREKMLADEQRRARLFGALIGAAVLAALAGLLTARRAFYQQHRLAEMKTNFVSSVSHELRAPIASMRLLAEALERGKISDAAKQQEYYAFLVQESRRLTSLIENVLDFSRIEQGRKEYRFEAADLDFLAQQTVKLMLPYAAERQVQLVWRPGPNPTPQLSCDGLALQQALINLMDNAIKHSPAGAAVDIGLESATECVRLWVEDRGPGIPPEEHEKIFERFYRRGSELRRETQGVGIGLTIVKHIVEAHGGRVLVRSGLGQGSRFTIELPLKQA